MPLGEKTLKYNCLHIMQRRQKQIFVLHWQYEPAGNLKSIFIVLKEEEAFCCADWVQTVGEGGILI